MKLKPIKVDSAFGMILTFLSVTSLLIVAIGGIAAIIWAVWVEKSALMTGCLVMVAIGLPIMWLEKLK